MTRDADRPAPVVLHPVRRAPAARSDGRALRDLRDVRREAVHGRIRPLAPAEDDDPWISALRNLTAFLLAALIFVAICARW